jgi:peptidyl-prolyl cis-trans isomerase SurA
LHGAAASRERKSSDTGFEEEPLEAPEATSRPTSTRTATAPVTRKQWSAGKATTLPSSRRGGGTFQSPVLMVNNEPITVQEVLDPIRSDLEKATKEMGPTEYGNYMKTRVMIQLVHLVDEMLAYDTAKKEITEEMETAIKKAVDQTEMNRINAEFGGRLSRYEAWLQTNGQKRDDVRKRIRRDLIVRQYLKDKFLPMVRHPTRQELMRYYQRHPEEFTEPLRVELFLIDGPYWSFLEGTPNEDRQALWPKVSGPRRLEARRAAQRHMEQALKEINSGIPFESVAQSYSRGPNAAKGGAWGFISPGGLTGRWTEVAEVLFQLKPGQVSDIMRTDDGLFLVKAGQRIERRIVPFVDAQPAIEKKLLKEQQDKLEGEFLSKLRNKATIGDIPPFLRYLYDAVPRQPGQRLEYKLDETAR